MFTCNLFGMLSINLLHIALSSSIRLHSSSMYLRSCSLVSGSLFFTLWLRIPHKFSTGQTSAILAAWTSCGIRSANPRHASRASLHLKSKMNFWPERTWLTIAHSQEKLNSRTECYLWMTAQSSWKISLNCPLYVALTTGMTSFSIIHA